jgi:hypothetical protein
VGESKGKEAMGMSRLFMLSILAAVVGSGAALPATAESTQEFKAQFHDTLTCPGVFLCGAGRVKGFGTATTTATVTSVSPGPGNCLTLAGERDVTLDSDGSTLQLALEGASCPNGPGVNAGTNISGTFAIVGGTGVFAGATGSGSFSAHGTGIPGITDTAHYEGTITLP